MLFLRLLESGPGPVRAEMKYIDVSIVERDMVWQAKFKSNAMKVYTTFLQWIYTHPVEFDTGVKVLGEGLSRKVHLSLYVLCRHTIVILIVFIIIIISIIIILTCNLYIIRLELLACYNIYFSYMVL